MLLIRPGSFGILILTTVFLCIESFLDQSFAFGALLSFSVFNLVFCILRMKATASMCVYAK